MTDFREELSGEATGSFPLSTSLSLVERMRRFDPESWQRFTRLYYPLVYVWCRRNRLQPADAHDTVQEVLHAVTESLERFDHDQGRNSFRGWLWGITRNKIRDHWRRAAGTPAALGDRDPEVVEPCDADAAGETALVCRRAMELVREEFEPSTWRAFWRTTVDGRPAADVADELGLSRNAVYLARSRVLRRLRVELEGLVDL